ncbi:MAG: hypothetical protein HDR20_15855 [Lachnospiraceae bacterium]|nr:hypothetical protein [Lachnospiraceae bacterium]
MHSKGDPFDYQVLNLTNKFYSDFPDPPYKEIVRKNGRPYNCLLVQSHYGYFICIPYRSHINHKYAFKFKDSIRSKRTNSGLDYSKIEAIVDKDEFNETRDNIEYIKNDAQRYIDNYVNYLMGKTTKYDKKEFERVYRYSTLKYFHNELEIAISNKDVAN